jgi:hypothetical protein
LEDKKLELAASLFVGAYISQANAVPEERYQESCLGQVPNPVYLGNQLQKRDIYIKWSIETAALFMEIYEKS